MMNLDDLAAVVQRSALAASEAFVSKHLEVIQQYFEIVEDEGAAGIAEETERAIAASNAAGAATDLDAARAGIREAAAALAAAAAKVSRTRSTGGVFRPKTTAVQFPQMTKDGPVAHTVHIPLLALTPISFPRIAELRFKTDLELSIHEGKIEVGFPASGGAAPASGEGAAGGPRPVSASIEIVVSEAPVNHGLRLVVEGYERALRAQIPG